MDGAPKIGRYTYSFLFCQSINPVLYRVSRNDIGIISKLILVLCRQLQINIHCELLDIENAIFLTHAHKAYSFPAIVGIIFDKFKFCFLRRRCYLNKYTRTIILICTIWLQRFVKKTKVQYDLENIQRIVGNSVFFFTPDLCLFKICLFSNRVYINYCNDLANKNISQYIKLLSGKLLAAQSLCRRKLSTATTQSLFSQSVVNVSSR